MNGYGKTPEAAMAAYTAAAAAERALPIVDQPPQIPPVPLLQPVHGVIIFTPSCHRCGTEIDDDRWFAMCLECTRVDLIEQRKISDELIRKLMAEIDDPDA